MKFSKRVTASLMSAALAASMTCALPALASAAPATTGADAATTYTAMAKSTVKETVKANAKYPLIFKLNGKKIKNTKITWKSGNAKIATVSKKGIVTTKKEGKVTVTGKYRGHTIYYKLTVKGDAARDRFNEAVGALEAGMMAKLEPTIENGEAIYRQAVTEEVRIDEIAATIPVTVSFDYNATTGQFSISASISILGTSYGTGLEFSDKYAVKTCTVTHCKNNQIVDTKTIKKSTLKSPGEPDMLLSDADIFKALDAGIIESVAKDKDVAKLCKILGFTSIDK